VTRLPRSINLPPCDVARSGPERLLGDSLLNPQLSHAIAQTPTNLVAFNQSVGIDSPSKSQPGPLAMCLYIYIQ
jgi:hypothetical protein